jgi:hypothetical protein
MNLYSFSGISNSWRRVNTGGSLINLCKHYSKLLGAEYQGNLNSTITLKNFFNNPIQSLAITEQSILNVEAEMVARLYKFERGLPDVIFAHSQGCNIAARCILAQGLNTTVVFFDPKLPVKLHTLLADSMPVLCFQSEQDFLGNQMVCNDRLIDKAHNFGEHYFIKALSHSSIISTSIHQRYVRGMDVGDYLLYREDLSEYKKAHPRMDTSELLEFKKWKNNYEAWQLMDMENIIVEFVAKHQHE